MKNAAYTKATAGRAEFRAELWEIALPVTLQCLLQSSFSVADQIMTGQLGSVNIAGIGLGGKFASIYSVMLAAIATAAGVMLAQYIGKRDAKGAGRSFYINLAASLILAAVFTALSLLFPAQLLSLYTDDAATVAKAAEYLKIFSLSFLPMALTAIFSAYLRCVQAAKLPLYALIAPVKVQNMISGGILRSGGRTGYVLAIDMIGTWVFGVPLGLVAAFALHLPIEGVYLLLSLEECVRLALSLVTFRRRRWMQRL